MRSLVNGCRLNLNIDDVESSKPDRQISGRLVSVAVRQSAPPARSPIPSQRSCFSHMLAREAPRSLVLGDFTTCDKSHGSDLWCNSLSSVIAPGSSYGFTTVSCRLVVNSFRHHSVADTATYDQLSGGIDRKTVTLVRHDSALRKSVAYQVLCLVHI
jgi:hypothetical protein